MFAQKGMVATSQPVAAQVGMDMMKMGGNAIDAAIATAACLTVVEPSSNGIGGDAFAIVWVKDKLYGLNASGYSPQEISIDKVKKRGYEQMPEYGWLPVTVPGAPASWVALSERFGKLSFKELLKPAIDYARHGFAVTPTVSYNWKKAVKTFSQFNDKAFKSWFQTFTNNGTAPEPGDLFKMQDHADTLEHIAETKGEWFYRGEFAEKIEKQSKEQGGVIKGDDLSSYQVEWVDPISVHYKGYDIWEIPPNGQGIITLMALNMLKKDKFINRDAASTIHKQIEAIKLAFTDAQAFISAPEFMDVTVDSLLSEEYSRQQYNRISDQALTPAPGNPPQGGTVYLATADNEGNMVSFIQSNYKGFGSGVVVEGTGVALQNRGKDYSLDHKHVNALAPWKKSYHTIIPGFITRDTHPIGPFGVMGGFMQPQGHLQVAMNAIDFHLNPQASMDAPRWQWIGNKTIIIEPHFDNNLALQLEQKGHQVQKQFHGGKFGRGQIIWKDEDNLLIGATDPRTDGQVAVW